ncbi:hypothetical protein AM501_20210 [Aneurinibacillus migulanus]|nr:PucR family transcriptional regulator [Aneurinibacillus migulanus]KPD06536.1 hypothetical protein AM501_20210 [Aneurinibacillus migulanus]MCP1356623.1 PucR family transcriptional regulator ligand-binding domain-containing protein [Aneurinibacillus migulanus]CEH29339.1 Purine catabolism regulatory protein-like familyp rotein [Aneurinibacillus migulanus]
MDMADVLRLPLLANASVVAGRVGLTRAVENVNMMDAPDIIGFLKPNTLLLTTAYAMKEAPHEISKLVTHMAEKGCAGLGIKTKRFLDEIPTLALEAGERLTFPIIEIPLDVELGDVSAQIISRILNAQTEELSYALDMNKRFSRLVMGGHGISDVTAALSSVICKPVLLYDHRARLLAEAYPDGGHSRFSADLKERLQVVIEKKAKRTDFPTWFSLCVSPEKAGEEIALFSFDAGQQRRGFIAVPGAVGADEILSLQAIKQAANVFGFDFMKQYALEEHMRRAKNEFLSDVLDAVTRSEEEIASRGKRYGLHKDQAYQCVVAKVDDSSKLYSKTFIHKEEQIRGFKDRLYEKIEEVLAHREEGAVLFTKSEYFVILFPLMERNKKDKRELIHILMTIQEETERDFHINLSFGIGNEADRLLDIAYSFQKALEALQMGYASRKIRFIESYRMKELVDVLRLIPDEALENFYRGTLKELADPDETEKVELARTLAIYLDNHCQVGETAKQLFLHRNTVAYRLNKCEEVLGYSVKSPNDTLRLRVAFLIGSMLKLNQQMES